MALPNLVIAGAPKCGTSSLFRWIADHPDAEGAVAKETRYFVDPDCHVFDPSRNFSSGGTAGYETFFPVRKPRAKIRLEATPVYLYQRTALAALPEIRSRPRFIFLLREPSRQILSTYRYFSNNWRELPKGVAFAEFLEMIEAEDRRLAANELLARALANARYVEHLSAWRDRLGAGRMRVLLLEALHADPAAELANLAEWLGLDSTFYADYAFPRENETYQVRSEMLQRANVALRGLVARTPFYRPARAIYRRLNTETAPPPLSPRDEAALADLKARFAEPNGRLAAEFGLDLTRWDAAPCP